MNKINIILNDNVCQNSAPDIKLTLGSSNYIAAGEGSPRAHNELKIGLYLFKCQDILSRILFYVEGENRKNFRLVCQQAALLTFKFFKYLVQLYPKDLIISKKGFTNTCKARINSIIFSPTLKANTKINGAKFKLITDNKFQSKLSLSSNHDLYEFHNLLLSKQVNKDSFIQEAQTIVSMTVTYLDEDKVQIFNEILKKINEYQIAFSNLKHLQTTGLSDLRSLAIPPSIESFEYCNNMLPVSDMYTFDQLYNVNICNLTNLKSITLDSFASFGNFKIENLQNLQYIKMSYHPYSDIKINSRECPNLSSIIISGQEMLFEKFSEIITIEASLS